MKEFTVNIDIKLKATKVEVDKYINEIIKLLDEIDFKHSFKAIVETSNKIEQLKRSVE